jgi:hypothetical protein
MSPARRSQRPVRRSPSRLLRALPGAALAAALSGCITFPDPFSDRGTPPRVGAELPSDLLQSRDETLVLAEFYGGKNPAAARFMKGSELPSVDQWLKTEYESGHGEIVFFPVCPFALIPCAMPGERKPGHEPLDKLCVLVADGRVVTIDVAANASRPRRLERNRRDAIVAALGGTGKPAFTDVDGPCGVKGAVEWPQALRARVAAYIAAMPAVEPAASDSALGRLLAAASTGSTGRPPAHPDIMLLVATTGDPPDPPVFLAGADFAAIESAARASSEADIIHLLPSYAPGKRDLENISVASFCAVSSDGRLLLWSSAPGAWESAHASSSFAPEAIDEARTDLGGAACVPARPGSWSPSDRDRVIAFLEHVRPQAAERSLRRHERELSDLRIDAGRSSSARYMLVAVDQSDSNTVRTFPVFLGSIEAARLVDLLRSLPPRELASRLRSGGDAGDLPPSGFRPDSLCIVSATGRIESFNASTVPDWQVPEKSWGAPIPWGSDEMAGSLRDEALRVVHTDDASRWDDSWCWLGHQRGWTPGLREAVIRFLERIPTAPQSAGAR